MLLPYTLLMPEAHMDLPLEAMLMFMVHAGVRSHADVCGLSCHLKLCWCSWTLLLLRAMLLMSLILQQEVILMSMVWTSTRDHIVICNLYYQWRLCWCLCCWWRPYWGPWSILPAKVMLISMAYVTSGDQVDIYGLCCCQRPCWCLWSMFLLDAMLISVAFVVSKVHDSVCGLVEIFC